MPKIIIVGGSSEIGNAIANELQKKFPGKFSEIVKISTSLTEPDSIYWNPRNSTGVIDGLKQVNLTKDDHVLISLGIMHDINSRKAIEEKIEAIANLYHVNLVVPVLALNYFWDKLEGGHIILLSSVAAFPVLDSNFVYGSSKQALDSMARYLQRTYKTNRPTISIVRSGYVQTKLNLGRKPTLFAQTTKQVAESVVKKIDKPVVWTPKIFFFVSALLRCFKPLRFIANRMVVKSKT